MRPKAIIIGVTESYCFHCNQPTLPFEPSHVDVVGWKPVKGGGCGSVYEYVSTDSPGTVTPERLADFFPNLPYIYYGYLLDMVLDG